MIFLPAIKHATHTAYQSFLKCFTLTPWNGIFCCLSRTDQTCNCGQFLQESQDVMSIWVTLWRLEQLNASRWKKSCKNRNLLKITSSKFIFSAVWMRQIRRYMLFKLKTIQLWKLLWVACITERLQLFFWWGASNVEQITLENSRQ